MPFLNSKERPYIHLVDSGVGDNIGARGVLTIEELVVALVEAGLPPARRVYRVS